MVVYLYCDTSEQMSKIRDSSHEFGKMPFLRCRKIEVILKRNCVGKKTHESFYKSSVSSAQQGEWGVMT